MNTLYSAGRPMGNKIETNRQVPRKRAALARATSQARNTGPQNLNCTTAAAAARGRGKTIHYIFLQISLPEKQKIGYRSTAQTNYSSPSTYNAL